MWSKKAADKKPKPVKEAGFMKNHKSNEKRTEVDIKPNTDWLKVPNEKRKTQWKEFGGRTHTNTRGPAN